MVVFAIISRSEVEKRISKAFTSFELSPYQVRSATDCAQRAKLERFDGIVIDSDYLLFEDGLTLIAFLRLANPDAHSSLLCQNLIRIKVCVCLRPGSVTVSASPFFASTLAVRIRHSIRFASSGVGWLVYLVRNVDRPVTRTMILEQYRMRHSKASPTLSMFI